MKKLIFLVFLIAIGIFGADIKIPIQGYLTDNNGVALNGIQNIKFSLYNIDENGTAIWSNSDVVDIQVNNGEFSYMLGTTDFIDSSILENSSPLYLEVEINNEILSPRIELGVESKAVYAYKSETSNTALNSEKLEGKTLTELKTSVKTEIENEKLQDILSRLNTLEAKVTNLEQENTSLKSRVTSLESNLSSLTTLVNNLKTKLDLITVTQNINLDNLKSNVTTNSSNIATNQTNIATNTSNIATNTHDLNDADGRLQYFVDYLSNRITPIETKTANMEIVNLTYKGVNYKTVRFSHVNVQIVNGTGATNRAENGFTLGEGLGNLIIGYNEEGNNQGNDYRTGYHNLIVGTANDYTSYGSVVFGEFNRVKAKYSTVTGGYDNIVDKPYSSISGGAQLYIPYGNGDDDNWFYWRAAQYHSN